MCQFHGWFQMWPRTIVWWPNWPMPWQICVTESSLEIVTHGGTRFELKPTQNQILKWEKSERKKKETVEKSFTLWLGELLLIGYHPNSTVLSQWVTGLFGADKTRERERAAQKYNVITVILTVLTAEFLFLSLSLSNQGHFETRNASLSLHYCNSL